MKKLLTMLTLSICSFISLNAAETTLWEGDHNVSWELPEGDPNKEWKELGQADFASFEVGQQLYFYFQSVTDAEYHQYQFDNWSWELLPGQEKTDMTGDTKVTLEITQEIKDAIAKNGFALHGHGFHVVKVTTNDENTKEELPDLSPALLWTGDITIDGWGAQSLVLTTESEGFDTFTEHLTTACNLYFLLENTSSCDFRIAGQWGDWATTSYPSDGYNHMQAIDADNVVKVTLTEDFITQAFINKGGISFWGNGGFKIKAIATTKEALDQTTTIKTLQPSVSEKNGHLLNGIRASKPTNGFHILDGKKYYVR